VETAAVAPRVVDVDSHVSEPPDLWLSRLPAKWAEVAPQISWHAAEESEYWYIGGAPVTAAWKSAMAGWPEYPPSHPRKQTEADPASFDPHARASRLREFGVGAQVLYPNVVWFRIRSILEVADVEFQTACLRAYNDFTADFAAAVPGVFVPLTVLPLWDLDEAIAEMERCLALGHRGVAFPGAPNAVEGLPPLASPHWYRLWEAVQANNLSVNFHIGFGEGRTARASRTASAPADARARAIRSLRAGRDAAEAVRDTSLRLMQNADVIADLICGGVCERFPELKFVSTESGYGYVPYLLDMLDWDWIGLGAAKLNPGWLRPSEYFRRQILVTFWFEDETLRRLADLYPDNIMFETDFPHVACIAPGPISQSGTAKELLDRNLAGMDAGLRDRILYTNAARIYGLTP
jgi:uncharacterized protein